MARPRRVVVVGGGLAGLRAVEALRREGFDGSISLIGEEPELPYDRPPLSKGVLAGERSAESCVFRSQAELDDLGVEVLLGAPASDLNLHARSISVGGGRIGFDGLIIATGAWARRLPALADRENVFVLRSMADARALSEALARGASVVVVGAGVIGMEVASSACARGLDVTIVEAAEAPMMRSVGATMGGICGRIHLERGVDVRCGTQIEAVEGRKRVERLRLGDGTVLEPDLVVVGIGVSPAIAWLQGSEIPLGDGIVCDRALSAGPSVFAAGDVANWPNELLGGRMRCEQWTGAVEQARHAAHNLLAGSEAARPFVSSNYFWSDQHGVRIQFAGSPSAERVTIINGDVDERRFLAWYRTGDRLTGALAMSSPQLLMQSKQLIEAGTSWSKAVDRLVAEIDLNAAAVASS